MFDSIYVMAKGGHQVYSGSPQELSNYLPQLDIKLDKNEVPIEVLLEYTSLGINDPKVRQMNDNCLYQTNKEFKEYSEQNMTLTAKGLKFNQKSFAIKDTLTLLRRQFQITFIAQFKDFLSSFTMLFIFNLLMVMLIDSKNGQYDGCVSLNTDNKTCSQIEDDKAYLYSSTSFLGLVVIYMLFALIMLMAPMYIDQYTVFRNECRNGEQTLYLSKFIKR